MSETAENSEYSPLTTAEFLADVIAETGEISLDAVEIVDALASAEGAENVTDLLHFLKTAKYNAEAVLMNLQDQISRFAARSEITR